MDGERGGGGAGEGGWGLRRRGWPDKFDFRPFSYHLTALKLDQTRAGYLNLILRQGTFLIGGGGPGLRRGTVISKYFSNWGGSNLCYTQPEQGRSIFWQEKNYFMSVS